MIYSLFIIYLFLSQFPALIYVGGSYVGFQILLLPFLYFQSLNARKCLNYILPLTVISIIVGLLKFDSFNYLEILLRFVAIFTVVISLILPIYIYRRCESFSEFKSKYLRKFILITTPSLFFCLAEALYRFSRNSLLLNLLTSIKEEIFVRNRGVHTIGTIAGMFPEHGLFPPFLFFISGLSFLFIDRRKFTRVYVISLLWIIMLLLHSSGLSIAALLISILLLFSLNIFNIVTKFSLSKKLIRFLLLLILLGIVILIAGPYYNEFLFKRFSLIINNYNLIGFAIDKTLQFKLLPYYVLLKTNINDFFIGAGSGYFTNLVVQKLNFLPTSLTDGRLFLSNFNNSRFALNSTIICAFLEYGFLLFIAVILIIRNSCQLFRPLNLFVNYSNLFKFKLKTNQIISIILLFSSFLTSLGAVPLTYPYPYLSLSILFIIFDSIHNSERIN